MLRNQYNYMANVVDSVRSVGIVNYISAHTSRLLNPRLMMNPISDLFVAIAAQRLALYILYGAYSLQRGPI